MGGDVGLAETVRARPEMHFTADDGWINDPYGVTWVEDRYHLFYQAIPGRVTWAPNCHWGHAESFDLVHWTERPLALTPQPFEVGCWSGSFVMDGDTPRILYTRVAGEDWGRGEVAIAQGDPSATRWTTGPDDVVIAGPPAELGVRTFRDPYIFRSGAGWTMIMAAGLDNGAGAALQYRSADLRTWSYDGVLCSRPSNRADDVWSGALWECPQLFPLGSRWVLLISVWDADILHYVAAAVGDYDGATFTPDTWQRLTYGTSAYAMTTFLDREGRRSVLSWLREEPQNNPALTRRAGAHSVPATLVLTPDGLLSLSPHPNLCALRTDVAPSAADGDITVGELPYTITFPEPALARITIDEPLAPRAVLTVDPHSHKLTVVRTGFPDAHMPMSEAPLQVLLDADIIEVFNGTSYGAFRIPPAIDPSATRLAVDSQGLHRLQIHALRTP